MFKNNLSATTRRLLPLYFAVFFQNAVLWYALEKLFMTSIGFDSVSIAILGATYATTMLVFETPSGLLADRWSRKGVLIIAGFALALASLGGGLSGSVIQYLIFSGISWGIYYALYSGTYDSIVYDTLIEETGTSKGYEKLIGGLHATGGAALVVSSLVGGVVGQVFGLREAYFITIPLALLSVVALWFLKEPNIHKAQKHSSIKSQVKSTFQAISKKGIVISMTITLVIIGLITQMLYEFDQLWLIALSVPVVFYGPANALLLSSVVVSGLSVKYLFGKRAVLFGLLVLMIISSICLASVKLAVVIVLAIFAVLLLAMIYEIIFGKSLHDNLESNIRAGAVSAISSISKLIFIPTALIFGFASQSMGIFGSAWIIVGLVILLCVSILVALRGIKNSSNLSEVDLSVQLDSVNK
jgi:MFS family permease